MMMMIIIIIIILKAIQTIPKQYTGEAKTKVTQITAILGTAHILRKVLMQSTRKTFNMNERYK